MVMFGYFFWKASISWSSKVFRPAPSHSLSSYLVSPRSVLTASVSVLALLLDEPGPQAATDARHATDIRPAITVLAVRSILIDHSFLPSGRSRLCLPWLSRLSVFAKRLCMRITDVEPVRQIRNTQTNGRFPKK